MTMLGARHIRNIAHQGQANIALSKFWGDGGVINYQFICADANERYFANALAVKDGFESVAFGQYKIFYFIRHAINISREKIFLNTTVFQTIMKIPVDI